MASILRYLVCFFVLQSKVALGGGIIDLIEIDSDNLIINKKEHSVTFKGNVVVRFDKIKIMTDLIIVHYDERSKGAQKQTDSEPKIKKIEIPNKLSGISECKDQTIIADRGEYDGKTKSLTLIGNVMANEGNKVLITNKLVYIKSFNNIKDE